MEGDFNSILRPNSFHRQNSEISDSEFDNLNQQLIQKGKPYLFDLRMKEYS